ncbi:MAG: hypothetical protein JWR18_1581 [Segetibacter sp.]|jgi:hypothetical protein|nr:hypothetical protein [Segetibacter sp.]
MNNYAFLFNTTVTIYHVITTISPHGCAAFFLKKHDELPAQIISSVYHFELATKASGIPSI